MAASQEVICRHHANIRLTLEVLQYVDDVFASKSFANCQIFLDQTLRNDIKDGLCSVQHLLLCNFDFILCAFLVLLLVLVFAVFVFIILIVIDPCESPLLLFNYLTLLIEFLITDHLILRVLILFQIVLNEFLWT